MSYPAEAASKLLAYGQKKARALSSRSYRVVSPTTNGSSFTMSQSLEFVIPGNQDVKLPQHVVLLHQAKVD